MKRAESHRTLLEHMSWLFYVYCCWRRGILQ